MSIFTFIIDDCHVRDDNLSRSVYRVPRGINEVGVLILYLTWFVMYLVSRL